MRRRSLVGTVIAGLLSTLAISAPASATGGTWNVNVPPPSDRIVIDLVTINGSGCPKGTAEVAVAPDNTAFTVTYNKFLAQIGGDAKTTDFRKNCQLSVVVHVPQGFTYAVAKSDYRGFASLAPGAVASERAHYYFQGQTETTDIVHNLTSPLADDWQFTDKTDLAALVWAPCGGLRNLNINLDLRVSAGSSDPKKNPSFINMDSTDSSIDTTYRFQWATCNTPVS